jgi:XTP/dITP diphosphohydrolase
VKLLIATTNRHKVDELRRALPAWQIEAWQSSEAPEETGATFEENARIKAVAARAAAPRDAWVAGEDSGIEAAGLGGRPGVESARWAEDGVAALLEALSATEDRRARYVCTIVALPPEGEEVVAVGRLDGLVAIEPRGSEGFGYDPIMVPAGETRTVAELGNAWKAMNSHRARAALALASQLGERLRSR